MSASVLAGWMHSFAPAFSCTWLFEDVFAVYLPSLLHSIGHEKLGYSISSSSFLLHNNGLHCYCKLKKKYIIITIIG